MRVHMKETVGSFETGNTYDVSEEMGCFIVAQGKAEKAGKDAEVSTPNKAMKKSQVKRKSVVDGGGGS